MGLWVYCVIIHFNIGLTCRLWLLHFHKIPYKHDFKFSLVKNSKRCGTHLESVDIQRLHANGVLLLTSISISVFVDT
jgi:hypothetical protein